MPKLLDTHERTVLVLSAAEWVLAERGIAGLSLRAIARGARISLGSLTSHYDSRSRLLHLLAQLAGRAWVEALADRTVGGRLAGFLPDTAADVRATRVWLSWCELARADAELRGRVRDVRGQERALLHRRTGGRLDADRLDVSVALLEGLRAAVCSGTAPMPTSRARDLWTAHLEAVLSGVGSTEASS